MVGRDFVAGIAMGFAAAAAVPLVLLAAAGANPRAITRTLSRTGDVLGGKARETVAELQEIFEDFMAEVRTEMNRPRVAAEPSAPPPSDAARADARGDGHDRPREAAA